MDTETETWLLKMVDQLDPLSVHINKKDPIIGYLWNGKRRELHLISQKEADKLTHKGVVWKHLKEDWKHD